MGAYRAGLESSYSNGKVLHEYTLTIAMTGTGTVVPAVGTHAYIEGRAVQLAAVNDAGSRFKEWTGDSVEDSTTMATQITMDSDKDIEVVFEEVVSLTIVSTGGGTTSPTPNTTIEYAKNSAVTLKAAANDGYVFTSWSGDVSSESDTVTITMDADKTVAATFNEEAEAADSSKILYYATSKEKAFWNISGIWTFFATVRHGLLKDLDKDHHPHYLTTLRHGQRALHALGDVVPHDDHKKLSNIGSKTHAQIDSHINNTSSNPHVVTAAQVGAIPANTDSVLPTAGVDYQGTFFIIPGSAGPPAVADKLYYCRSTDGGTNFEWKEVSLV